MNQASIRGPDELLEPAAQGRLAGDEPKLVSEAPTLLLSQRLAEDAARGCIRCSERYRQPAGAHGFADRSPEALPLHLMAEVTLYTKRMCRHCFRARRRLRRRGATIHEIQTAENIDRMRAELRDRFGDETFPQIVIGERYIGGADDLVRLDKSGELARLLAE